VTTSIPSRPAEMHYSGREMVGPFRPQRKALVAADQPRQLIRRRVPHLPVGATTPSVGSRCRSIAANRNPSAVSCDAACRVSRLPAPCRGRGRHA
jgi:hypothetical protein